MSGGSGTLTPAVTVPVIDEGGIFGPHMRAILNGDMGIDAVWTPTGKTPVDIRAIFNKLNAPELGMEGYRIWIEVMTADIPGAVPGEPIIIGDTTYKIKDPPAASDDGTSIIELSLD
jgi:hypothetical protein